MLCVQAADSMPTENIQEMDSYTSQLMAMKSSTCAWYKAQTLFRYFHILIYLTNYNISHSIQKQYFPCLTAKIGYIFGVIN